MDRTNETNENETENQCLNGQDQRNQRKGYLKQQRGPCFRHWVISCEVGGTLFKHSTNATF